MFSHRLSDLGNQRKNIISAKRFWGANSRTCFLMSSFSLELGNLYSSHESNDKEQEITKLFTRTGCCVKGMKVELKYLPG